MPSLNHRELIELIPFAFIHVDLQGRYLFANSQYTELTGYTLEELGSLPYWSRFTCTTTQLQSRQWFEHIITKQPKPEPLEMCVNHKDGSDIFTRTLWGYLRDEQGDLASIMFFVEDVTESKRTKLSLQRSVQQYQDLFQNSHDPILIIENNRFIDCNQATIDLLGYDNKEQCLKTHPSQLSPPYQPDGQLSYKKANEMGKIAEANGSHRFEWVHLKANGEPFPVEVTLTYLTNFEGTQTVHTAWRDLTEFKAQQELIIQQAHFDSLTNLPNRFLLLDRLQQLVKETRRNRGHLAVIFIDLDNFKVINDSLGHHNGDTMLKEAAGRLSAVIRGSDTVGRLGGDEFLLILNDLAKPSDAEYVAMKVIEQFNRAFELGGREFMLTASIGIACFPDDGQSDTELLQHADMAMYHSKGEGKNRYHFFTERMNNNVQRRLQLEGQLHGALARREFNLLFQPIINLTDMRVEGAEALLRWENSAFGSISPDEFIPIAEHMGFIEEIGLFVLETALYEAQIWRSTMQRDFVMSINVSPQQIKTGKLFNELLDTIAQSPLPNHLIQLEITEGVLMMSDDDIMHCFKRLQTMGIQLGLDDFGTGYSSLNYLRKYPFTALKIDKSFVDSVAEDLPDQELVTATIAMANAMGLKLVAEGIENQQQCEYLTRAKCQLGQGYLFSKPIPAEALFDFVTRFEHRDQRQSQLP